MAKIWNPRIEIPNCTLENGVVCDQIIENEFTVVEESASQPTFLSTVSAPLITAITIRKLSFDLQIAFQQTNKDFILALLLRGAFTKLERLLMREYGT